MMIYNDNYYYQQEKLVQTITNVAATSYYYDEPIGKEQQQQQELTQENWNMELDNEQECYAQYDLNMANAVVEADYQDYYCGQQQQHYYQDDYYNEEEEEDEYNDTNDYYQPQETTRYDYQNDSLLSLVVGVQSYLTEQADFNNSSAKRDSPLYNLQYKMYTYMRQRALELGLDL